MAARISPAVYLGFATALIELGLEIYKGVQQGVTADMLAPGPSAEAEFAAHEKWAGLVSKAGVIGIDLPSRPDGDKEGTSSVGG